MNGTTIKVEKSLKYLGTIIDFRLSWDSHIEYITGRTGLICQSFSQVAKQKWGLSSKSLSIIYESIYLPTITYACGTWGWATTKVHPRRKLISSQRKILLLISKAYRTTSNASLQVITMKPPIDLVIEEKQKLYKLKGGKNIIIENRVITQQDIEWPSPISQTLPPEKVIFHNEGAAVEDTLAIYTDGSYHDNSVGCSYVIYKDNREIDYCKFRLHSDCTIFQAEMHAIKMAIEDINHNFNNHRIKIYTDSSSSVQTIKNRNLNPTAERIREIILASTNKFEIEWVRAHKGETGNERADFLAKEAAVEKSLPIAYNKLSKNTLCNILRNDTFNKWQNMWNQHTGHITYQFIPNLKEFKDNKWYNPNHNCSQMLTSHGRFASYLHKFKHCTSKLCPTCNIEEDGPSHYIYRCPTFERERLELKVAIQEQKINWPCRPSDIWTTKSTYMAFDRMCSQINYINRNQTFT
ncbi:uncharacterized protein [Centruroides vittatus]|uniref:uncharacterized protein n=1 Tax=Centruroides vittatus TaxID=120091 RepID=UPI0035103D40